MTLAAIAAAVPLPGALTGKKIAFTNGCFDLLHEGHIYSLSQAAAEADFLVVGVNADSSVKKLKGENRPINNEQSRALILASLLIVDAVVIFARRHALQPDQCLTPRRAGKRRRLYGYTIVGAKEVLENGGRVVVNPIKEGFSTTGLIIQNAGYNLIIYHKTFRV